MRAVARSHCRRISRTWASAEALVGGVEHALGPIDILVNNAGITRYIPFPNVHDVTP